MTEFVPFTRLCDTCGSALPPQSNAHIIPRRMLRETSHISAVQRSELQEQILLLDAELDVHDKYIERLGSALAMAEKRREALRRSKHRHNALLSPVRRLPDELLSDVFLKVVEGESFMRFNEAWQKLVLGWVCARWRNVALNTPQLWNKFDVGTMKRKLLCKVWLLRSENLPLDVQVSFPEDLSLMPRHLQPVLKVASRWRRVSFMVDSICPEVFPQGPLHLPLLEHLSVDVFGTDRIDSYALPAFKDAPLLRSVYLYDVPVETAELPWHQLTSLDILGDAHNWVTMPRLLAFLGECPNLETLTVGVKLALWPNLDAMRVQNASLRNLTLRCYDADMGYEHYAPLSIFDAITLPSLSTFQLLCPDHNILWDHLAFMGFLARSKCDLGLFVIRNPRMESESMLDMLSALPTIETLILDPILGNNGDAFYKRATYPTSLADTNYLLPNIRHLHLDQYLADGETFDEDALIAMVWSRIRHETVRPASPSQPGVVRERRRLDSLHIGDCDFLSDRVEAEIYRWREAGLRVTMD